MRFNVYVILEVEAASDWDAHNTAQEALGEITGDDKGVVTAQIQYDRTKEQTQ